MASFSTTCDWLSSPARLGQLHRIGRNPLALPLRLGQLLQLRSQLRAQADRGARPLLEDATRFDLMSFIIRDV